MALRPKGDIPLPARMIPDPGPRGIVSPRLDSGPLPHLDVEAFTAPALGLANLGQGVQRAGAAVTALAEKRAESDSLVSQWRVAEVMAQAKRDIGNAVGKEQDSNKWNGQATEILGKAQALVANIPMDAETRALVDHKWKMNETEVMTGLESHANVKSFGDGRSALLNTLDLAGETMNQPLREATVKRMTDGSHPFFRDDEARLADHRAGEKMKAKRQDAQWGIILTAGHADPVGTLKELDNPNSAMALQMAPETKAKSRNYLQREIREQTAQLAGDAQNLISLPDKDINKMATAEEVDKWQKDNPLVTPAMRESIHATVDRRNAAGHKAYMEANAPEIASRFDSEISMFDPSDANSEKDYYDLLMRIGDLPDDVAAPLRKKLNAVRNNEALPADHTLQGAARKVTQSMFDQGLFGQWWYGPAIILDGRMVKSKITGKMVPSGEEVPISARDVNPEAERAAIWQRSKLDGAVTRELQKHPEWATDPKGTEKMQEFMNRKIPYSTLLGTWDRVTGSNVAPEGEAYKPAGKRRRGEGIPKGIPVAEEALPEGNLPANADAIRAAPGAVTPDTLRASLPTPLKSHAKDFVDAADETGLDPRFLAAVSMFETGDGTSPAFRNKNNAMGISNRNGPTNQPSVRESIFRQAHMLASSKGPYRNASTIDEIAAIYSPPGAENDPNDTNAEWPEAVKRNLRRLKK